MSDNSNSSIIISENATGYECSGVSPEELAFFNSLSFWIGGVAQVVLCFIGAISNAISIPVLRSKTLFKSTFNRLLLLLAICDNIYLTLALLESLRQEGIVKIPWHNEAFVYFLYPFHNIVLCLSIFMTVVLAMERYKAISEPIDYHAIIVSGRQWQRVHKYMLPVLFLSVTFNVPKFLELRINHYTIHDEESGEEVIKSAIGPTKLRLNDDYAVYYHNHARLIVTGLIPLITLINFNCKIYESMKIRRQNMQGLLSSRNTHSQQVLEENRQALILFGIVILFLVCHVPRNFLNVHEALTFERKKADYLAGCGGMPLWILIIGLISHLLLTCNSALNFFLYCAMSEVFRTELKLLWTRYRAASNNSSNNYLVNNNEEQGSHEMTVMNILPTNSYS